MERLIPANRKTYNHKASFDKYGYIDWDQKYDFYVGQILYIYSTAPEKRISYVTVVEKIDMHFDEITDDKEFWTSREDYDKHVKYGRYCRIKLIREINDIRLIDTELYKHGLTGRPQKSNYVSPELSEYIKSIISNSHTITYPDESSTFEEGGVTKSIVNRYERNPDARKVCIDYYGYKCQVCGFDFVKVYGQIGKEFIHVHHIEPIGMIKQNYIINPIKDLIPVCPNCHAMLHKIDSNGKLLTVSQLKKIINTP